MIHIIFRWADKRTNCIIERRLNDFQLNDVICQSQIRLPYIENLNEFFSDFIANNDKFVLLAFITGILLNTSGLLYFFYFQLRMRRLIFLKGTSY